MKLYTVKTAAEFCGVSRQTIEKDLLKDKKSYGTNMNFPNAYQKSGWFWLIPDYDVRKYRQRRIEKKEAGRLKRDMQRRYGYYAKLRDKENSEGT